MALFDNGDEDGARRKLEESRKLLQLVAAGSTPDPALEARIYWYDWSLARILFREAEATLNGTL